MISGWVQKVTEHREKMHSVTDLIKARWNITKYRGILILMHRVMF